jgi:MerT mercuric transport protein
VPNSRPWLAGGAAVGGLAGALTAAIAGLCCAGPVTFMLLGAGGAVAAAGLRPYRLPLLLLSAAILGVAYWRTYRGTGGTGTACPPRMGKWIKRSFQIAIVAWVAAAVMWVAACAPSAPPGSHLVIGANDEPLKSTFNANVGKVRVIMLVAPT